jgi:ketosteroid isomerase-like protein
MADGPGPAAATVILDIGAAAELESDMSKLLILFAVVALMTPSLATNVVEAPSNEEDVRKFVFGFVTAWNQHDMEAFGKLFAADADFVNVVGVRWKGGESIQLHHAWSHGTIPRDTPGFEKSDPHYGIFKTSTLQFTKIDVRFLRNDVAVALVDSELVGDARIPNPRQGVLTLVLIRQAGSWLIAAAQNTEVNRTVK